MKLRHLIQVVDSHTCGHPTRLVMGGLPLVRGKTVREKQQDFARRYDHLRGTLLHEPRGHTAMFGAILCEPGDPQADAGLMFVSTYKYFNMCGHGTIGAVTCLIELGILPAESPHTDLRIEVPAGTIHVRATVQDGEVVGVSFENVPSYVWERDLKVVHEAQHIPVDLAYGGLWYMLVKAEDLGCRVAPEHLRHVMDRADGLKAEVNALLEQRREQGEEAPRIDSALVYEQDPAQGRTRNVVVLSRSKFDRSPCGTGSSALAALLAAQGVLREGECFTNEGILGTSFRVQHRRRIVSDGQQAIVPAVTGRAHITGFGHLVVDEHDPLRGGFLIG